MIDPVIYIQRKFRLYTKIFNKMNNEIVFINNFINKLMQHITSIYKNELIIHQLYFRNISKLEDVYTKFNVLPKKLSIYHNYLSIKQIRDIIEYIYNKLKEICKECGMNNINNIMLLNNLKYTFLENDYIDLIINEFMPISYYLIDKHLIKDTHNDCKLLKDIEIYKCIKLKTTNTMIEYINGSKIVINYNNILLVVTGVFNDDILNLYTRYPKIKEKVEYIKGNLDNLNCINKSFKQNYVTHLRCRDLFIYNSQEIINNIIDDYHYVLDLKDNNISTVVKIFLTKELEEQYDIIKLFLIMEDDLEIQYLANLLYDMISTESYLLKSQPLSYHIYNCLHWSLQKRFKGSTKNIENNATKNIDDFTISYEKQIELLKVPDNIKKKALDKYNDVINKGGESSSKSQQYLDGLLKIPFKTFKREPIIKFIDDFQINLNVINTQLLHILTIYKDQNIICESRLVTLRNEYNKFNSYNTKNNYLKSVFINDYLNNLNSELIDLSGIIYDYDNDEKNNETIEIVLKEYKIHELRKMIKGLGISINLRQKKTIIDKLIDYYKNIANIITKIDIHYYIVNKSIILKQNTQNEHDIIEFCNLFMKCYDSWKSYNIDSKKYIEHSTQILNEAIYSQDDAKLEIERIIAQWINGEMRGYCFGFEGPPGTGKTSLAKKGISKCLRDENGDSRPFAFIAMGGSSNASTLEGHSYTYVGSSWGKIVEILMDKKCMNPIIYIDELDKISKTENGREIIGILTHITDSSQNEHFNDKYFSGIDIDLSKILFIFSYNDFNQIDPILADRIHRIKFSYLDKYEKIHIVNNYLLKEILNDVGFDENQIIFDSDVIEYIITKYTYEAGIRKLKEKLIEIIREINLMYIRDNRNIVIPFIITKDIVETIFSKKLKIISKLATDKPKVGMVNGLFATTAGIGGLTLIETFKTPSDNKLSLLLTGQQGDVMKESMNCAKTIAWNIIPESIKSEINKDWKNNRWGLHIHCPEAATPKDGPSAGGAITLAIISRLCNIPVNNEVALTGEINLNGEIHAIGGLDIKIDGGKNAGIKKILFPHDNIQDYELIKRNKPDIVSDIELVSVKTIWEILDHCLVDHNISFNKDI